MAGLAVLDASALAGTVRTYRDLLATHRDALNRLNVFPVADADTGTNLLGTLDAVCAELEGVTGMEPTCRAVAHGSLLGAQGNSGVILSQVLRALAEWFAPLEVVSGPELVAALRRATDTAYEAVARPVEGTILTVLRAATEAVERTAAAAPLAVVAETGTLAARRARDDTPTQLAVLADAGVVDAGGAGLVLLFEALWHVVDGHALPEAPTVVRAVAPVTGPEAPGGPRYEVMFLLDAPDDAIGRLRDAWSRLGESVVVVGGDGTWNCHIHTDDIGGSIEAGISVGRPSGIRVTDLERQVHDRAVDLWAGDVETTQIEDAEAEAAAETAVVVVAGDLGAGTGSLVASLGARPVRGADLVVAVERAPGRSVVALAVGSETAAARAAVAGLAVRSGRPVRLLTTRSEVAMLAALVAHQARVPVEADLTAMTRAAAGVRSGAVRRATRDAADGSPGAGDWVAVLDRADADVDGAGEADGADEPVVAGAGDPGRAATALVDHLIGDGAELVTVLVGAEATEDDTRVLRDHLAARHPGLDVEIHPGGRTDRAYVVGVE